MFRKSFSEGSARAAHSQPTADAPTPVLESSSNRWPGYYGSDSDEECGEEVELFQTVSNYRDMDGVCEVTVPSATPARSGTTRSEDVLGGAGAQDGVHNPLPPTQLVAPALEDQEADHDSINSSQAIAAAVNDDSYCTVEQESETDGDHHPMPARVAESREYQLLDSNETKTAFRQPQLPAASYLREMSADSECDRATVPSLPSVKHLQKQLQLFYLTIHGYPPFSETADRSDSLINYLLRKHPNFCKRDWNRNLMGRRVYLNGRSEHNGETPTAEGDTIDFVGTSTGGLIDALALATHLAPREVSQQLADFLETREDELFNGAVLHKLVIWDRTNLPVNNRTWASLVQRIRDEPMLSDTGTDHLCLVAAAHVFGPVLLMHSGPTKALRFVAEDSFCSPSAMDSKKGYVLAAHPPPGENWIKLALLEGDHYVFCPPAKMAISELKQKLDSSAHVPLDESLMEKKPHLQPIGVTGAGKSTIINGLAGKEFYITGELYDQTKLAVIGDHVPGSRIAPPASAASETQTVSRVLLQTGDDSCAELVVLDPPGSGDTGGELKEILHSVNRGKAMKQSGPLRLMVIVREEDIMGAASKGQAFVEIAKECCTLFPTKSGGGGFSAANHTLLVINTGRHLPNGWNDKEELTYLDTVVKKLESIRQVRAQGDPGDQQAAAFILQLLDQTSKSTGRKRGPEGVIVPLFYEESEPSPSQLSGISQLPVEIKKEYPPLIPIKIVKLRTNDLMVRILNVQELQRPAEKCSLPLSEKALKALHLMVRGPGGVRDRMEYSVEQRDIPSIVRILFELDAVIKHLIGGTGHMNSCSNAINELKDQLNDGIAKAGAMMTSETGSTRLEELHAGLTRRGQLNNSILDQMCFTINFAAEGSVLAQSFLANQQLLRPSEVAASIKNSITRVKDDAIEALKAPIESKAAVYEMLKSTVLVGANKLSELAVGFQQVADCCSLSTADEFRSIQHHAMTSLQELELGCGEFVQELTATLLVSVEQSFQKASQTSDQWPQKPGGQVPAPAGEDACLGMEEAADALTILNMADSILGNCGIAEAVVGKYSAACTAVMHFVKPLCNGPVTAHAPDTIHEQNVQMKDRALPLLFSLRLRSSSLRQHFLTHSNNVEQADDQGATEESLLDGLYERLIASVVSDHKDVSQPVLEAASSSEFVKHGSDYRKPTEKAFILAQLATVEKMQPACRASPHWKQLLDNHEQLRREISVAFFQHSEAAIKRLSTNIGTACCEYSQHAEDLDVLEHNAWWDALSGQGTIERAIKQLWKAFLEFAESVTKGPESAVTKLKNNSFKEASSDLQRLFSMEVLWNGKHSVIGAKGAETVQQLHQTAKGEVDAVLAKECAAIALELQQPCLEIFKALDRFLNLAYCLHPLEPWLDLGAIYDRGGLQEQAKRSAITELKQLRDRAINLFEAMAECKLERICQAEHAMCKKEYGDDQNGMTTESVKETIRILKTLHDHTRYPAIFAAAAAEELGDEVSSFELSKTPYFDQLQSKFHSSLLKANTNFSKERTQQASREKVLRILERMNEEFQCINNPQKLLPIKKDAEGMLLNLSSTNGLVMKAMNAELRELIASHNFSDDLYRRMDELFKSSQLDDDAKHTFDQMCKMLTRELRLVIESVRRGFALEMLHPERRFDCMEHLIVPWVKLEAARTLQIQRFLDYPTVSEHLVLDEARKILLHDFRCNVKLLLRKFRSRFDERDYVGAEGLGKGNGFTKVDAMLQDLQHHSSSKILFDEGAPLLWKERSSQCEVLSKLPAPLEGLDDGTLSLVPPRPAKAARSVEAQAAAAAEKLALNFCDWVEESFKQRSALSDVVKSDALGDMHKNYSDALQLLDVKVPEVIRSVFAPLTVGGQEFLNLELPAILQFERVCRKLEMNKSLWALHAEILDKAKSAIEMWMRGSKWAPVTPARFSQLCPTKQVTLIKDSDAMSCVYSQFLDTFRSQTTDVTTANGQYWREFCDTAKGEAFNPQFDQKLVEMRERFILYTIELPNAPPLDASQIRTFENDLANSCKRLFSWLSSKIQEQPADDAAFTLFLTHLRMFVCLVRAADAAAKLLVKLNVGDKTETGSCSWLKKNLSDQYSGLQPHAVITSLQKWLIKLRDETVGPLESPSDAARRFHSLGHIKRLCGGNGNGLVGSTSAIDLIIELDGLLGRTCSVSTLKDKLVQLSAQGIGMLKSVKEKVDCAVTDLETNFDPKTMKALDRELFHFLLGRELADLLLSLQNSDEQMAILDAIDTIKAQVPKKAEEAFNCFKSKLREAKYEEANTAEDQFQYLKHVLALDHFKDVMVSETTFKDEISAHATHLSKKLKDHLEDGVDEPTHIAETARLMLALGQFGNEVTRAASSVNPLLNNQLGVAQKAYGALRMIELARELRQVGGVLGEEIVGNSGAFKALVVEEINDATKKDLEEVKTLFETANKGNFSGLWDYHNIFKRQYDRDLDFCVKRAPSMNLDPLNWLVVEANLRLGRKPESLVTRFTAAVGLTAAEQQQIPVVLAALLAWWTMDFYLRTPQPAGPVNKAALRKANAMQVICILRLLGACSNTHISLKNHLAQVPTGEGKSVILGVTSTLLALLRYDVECVCYSDILSTRDQNDFSEMFNAFGVGSKIHYGTWDNLASKLFTEVHGDIRQQCVDFLQGKPYSAVESGPKQGHARRILLADEVDTFLSREFFNMNVAFVFQIHSDEITDLFKYMWRKRHGKASSMPAVMRTVEYERVMKATTPHNRWFYEWAIQKQHSHMAAYKQSNHHYRVHEGRIEYKMDGRDEYGTFTHTYETNCTMLDECDRGNLTPEQLHLPLWGNPPCAAYASLTNQAEGFPQFFTHILGVTGTLDKTKLPPGTHDLLKDDLKIARFTICPSMYSAGQRDWEPNSRSDVRLALNSESKISVHEDDHFHMIVDEIKRRLQPTVGESMRSVLVFFKDLPTLKRFYATSYFETMKHCTDTITEERERMARNGAILKATHSGRITLATRPYGRGTDFKALDKKMLASGGMHVLCTFFPSDVSEETQIIGRTCRQGANGSISMVLFGKDLLETLDGKITIELLDTWKCGDKTAATTVYNQLAKIREDISRASLTSLRKIAQSNQKIHNQWSSRLRSYQNGDTEAMMELLREYNH